MKELVVIFFSLNIIFINICDFFIKEFVIVEIKTKIS